MEATPAEVPSAPDEFSPGSYWESRLGETWGFAGVGLKGHGRRFNEILYRVRRAVFLAEVRRLAFDVPASDVLDIGSGTGFYVDLWRELGAKSIRGSDLTEVAVTHLRRTRPGIEFQRLDIGGSSLPYEPGSFDIVSVFDVFFHIVDDARFARAIANIASLLRPGGWLIFSDALLTPTAPSHQGSLPPHITWRREDAVRRILEENGLAPGGTRPVFVLLNPPIDIAPRLIERVWPRVSRTSSGGEARGAITAAVLYPIERLLLKYTKLAPTTKMLAAQLRS